MASEAEFLQIIGRAVVDPGFRAQLAVDPATAARSAGVELTTAQLAALRLDSGQGVAQLLDERLPKHSAELWLCGWGAAA